MPAPGEHHPAFEEYCECIFELAEDDVDIIQARIADRLLVSRPAVSEMIKRLEAEGLLTNDGAIVLTAAGIELAERVVRRHDPLTMSEQLDQLGADAGVRAVRRRGLASAQTQARNVVGEQRIPAAVEGRNEPLLCRRLHCVCPAPSPGCADRVDHAAQRGIAIRSDMIIDGPGSGRLTIDGNRLSRIFNVDDGASTRSNVILRGLTLANGMVSFRTSNLLRLRSTVSGPARSPYRRPETGDRRPTSSRE